MSDDNKNQNGEFDENFDDLDFDDSDLADEEGLYDDIPDEDVDSDFDSEQFEEEWEEGDPQDQSSGKDKRQKDLYTNSSERKGFSLSFNTMVIIGALLLGGSVMAYTVMTKTAQ